MEQPDGPLGLLSFNCPFWACLSCRLPRNPAVSPPSGDCSPGISDCWVMLGAGKALKTLPWAMFSLFLSPGYPDHMVFSEFRRRFDVLAPHLTKKHGRNYIVVDEKRVGLCSQTPCRPLSLAQTPLSSCPSQTHLPFLLGRQWACLCSGSWFWSARVKTGTLCSGEGSVGHVCSNWRGVTLPGG